MLNNTNSTRFSSFFFYVQSNKKKENKQRIKQKVENVNLKKALNNSMKNSNEIIIL